jgi:hypothetical protein
MDPEGFRLGSHNDAWICEEYGPSIWHVSLSDGKVIKRYAPFTDTVATVSFDTTFQKRHPNRGFEGIALTPGGKIYAILESALYNPDASTGDGSRIIRILELDTATNQTRTFVYLHSAAVGKIREKDWKVSDMIAVNDTVFLIDEHAARKTDNYHRLFLINISAATPVTQTSFDGKTLEALTDSAGLAKYSITPVQKTLYLDLVANKWNIACEKSEGIAIINDTTIAVGNDNDYGMSSPNDDGAIVASGIQTTIYRYTLPSSMKLNYHSSATSVSNQIETPGTLQLHQNYPNPFNPTTEVTFTIPSSMPVTVRVYDLLGRTVSTLLEHEIQSAGMHRIAWNAAGFPSGMYLIQLQTPNGAQTKKAFLLK